MKDKIITIAVPTYNMEQYLSRCLDSLLLENQSLFSRVEVLVINDGSKDRSLEIAREYEVRFPEVFRVIDKPNGNYGSCLNMAFKEARGAYFRTLDADDWFDKQGFADYVSFLISLKEVPDLILTGYFTDWGNICKRHKPIVVTGNKTLSSESLDLTQQQYSIQVATFSTNSVIRNLALQEGICYTDIEVCSYALPYIRTYAVTDTCLYHYFLGRDGQSVSIDSYKKNVNHMWLIINRFIYRTDVENYIVKSQQREVILPLINFYYTVCLLYGTLNENYAKFLQIDADIKKYDPALYSKVLNMKYIYFPYVKYWHHWPKGLFAFYACSLLRFYEAYTWLRKLKHRFYK